MDYVAHAFIFVFSAIDCRLINLMGISTLIMYCTTPGNSEVDRVVLSDTDINCDECKLLNIIVEANKGIEQ